MCALTSVPALRQAKLHMTVSADAITCKQRIRFDRKPEAQMELDLIGDLKSRGFVWSGYSDNGKWEGIKELVEIWEDKSFRQRVCLCVGNLTFYGPNGTKYPVQEMAAYITAIKTFDTDALSDDLSNLGQSSVEPNPVGATPPKRGRS